MIPKTGTNCCIGINRFGCQIPDVDFFLLNICIYVFAPKF